MAIGRKKSLRGQYACAEDLCDPHTDAIGEDGEAANAHKPRRHAVRLMDELGEVDAPAKARPVCASPPSAMPQKSVSRPALKQMRDVYESSVSDAVDVSEGYTVLSVHPEGNGETVAVVLSTPIDAGRERLKLHLLLEQYTDLRVHPGAISPESAENLLSAARICAAVMRGIHLLSYGDQSARRLTYKLTVKGVDRVSAEAAAAYLTERGYIHEDSTARRRVEQGLRKGWGPRRIREDLRANGFTPEAVDDAMEALTDVNFEDRCAEIIQKKYREVPDDRVARQKMTASLLRLGYDGDVIRAAMQRQTRER